MHVKKNETSAQTLTQPKNATAAVQKKVEAKNATKAVQVKTPEQNKTSHVEVKPMKSVIHLNMKSPSSLSKNATATPQAAAELKNKTVNATKAFLSEAKNTTNATSAAQQAPKSVNHTLAAKADSKPTAQNKTSTAQSKNKTEVAKSSKAKPAPKKLAKKKAVAPKKKAPEPKKPKTLDEEISEVFDEIHSDDADKTPGEGFIGKHMQKLAKKKKEEEEAELARQQDMKDQEYLKTQNISFLNQAAQPPPK